MSEARLDYTATGMSDNMVGFRFLDLLMIYDQIDPGRRVADKLTCGKIQMCHDRLEHKLVSFTSSANAAGGRGYSPVIRNL